MQNNLRIPSNHPRLRSATTMFISCWNAPGADFTFRIFHPGFLTTTIAAAHYTKSTDFVDCPIQYQFVILMRRNMVRVKSSQQEYRSLVTARTSETATNLVSCPEFSDVQWTDERFRHQRYATRDNSLKQINVCMCCLFYYCPIHSQHSDVLICSDLWWQMPS